RRLGRQVQLDAADLAGKQSETLVDGRVAGLPCCERSLAGHDWERAGAQHLDGSPIESHAGIVWSHDQLEARHSRVALREARTRKFAGILGSARSRREKILESLDRFGVRTELIQRVPNVEAQVRRWEKRIGAPKILERGRKVAALDRRSGLVTQPLCLLSGGG